jgi:uncharacterized membrane protein
MSRAFSIAVGLLALVTVAGLVALWPTGVDPRLGVGLATPTDQAQVERIEEYRCSGFQTDTCRRVTIRLQSGSREGRAAQLTLGTSAADPELSVGDAVRVTRAESAPGAELPPDQEYSLTDFERRVPMLVLALLFGLLVVGLGRLRGALSLLGLGLSLAVVLAFVAPAILAGEPPLLVAVVGSFAVMLLTVPLAHGLGAKGTASILGTALSLILTVALAALFTDLTHLTGLSSEEATLLNANDSGIPLDGLLLAGMVIAALGVLDDVTVSQASTVLALRGANPSLGARELFDRALHVGRDHVSATVNTLVLAYAGASLPLLLIFSSSELGLVETANLEVIAKEIVATLVGSVGLVAAVPMTTGLAALLAMRLPARSLEGASAHVH